MFRYAFAVLQTSSQRAWVRVSLNEEQELYFKDVNNITLSHAQSSKNISLLMFHVFSYKNKSSKCLLIQTLFQVFEASKCSKHIQQKQFDHPVVIFSLLLLACLVRNLLSFTLQNKLPGDIPKFKFKKFRKFFWKLRVAVNHLLIINGLQDCSFTSNQLATGQGKYNLFS